MAGKQRFTPKQVADTLTETRGMVFLAAKKLGCSDDTIYNYAKRYKAVGDALRQQRGQFVDMAELKLWNAVNEGEAWAVQFALRTLGKERGYVERSEVTHDFSRMSDEQLRNYIRLGLESLSEGNRGSEAA